MPKPIDNISWFDVPDPSSSELDDLARRFGLHELQIEDCRDRPHRPKTEQEDKYLFMIVKHIRNDGALRFDDIDLFLAPDFLISVHQGGSEIIDRVKTRTAQEKHERLDQLFYFIIDAIVDGYQPVLDQLATEISETEDIGLDRPESETLEHIFQLRRKLVDFRRYSAGMREAVNFLGREKNGVVHQDLGVYFRDIYDHVIRAADMIETYSDMLTGLLDFYVSAASSRTNQVMKVLTIWGTVALPLVIITGVFGINLKLPWTSDTRGVWYAIGLMAVSTLAVLLYFKSKRWF